MSKWTKAITSSLALATANFLYQLLGSMDWDAATERSYFQAVAILSFVLIWVREDAA